LLMASACRPCPRTRLTIDPCSMTCTPVNRHRNRGPEAPRTGPRPRIYRPGGCVFLLIQAEYRGFTGGGVAQLGAARRPQEPFLAFVSHFRGALRGGFPANNRESAGPSSPLDCTLVTTQPDHSPKNKGRARRPMDVFSFATVRDMSLSYKHPALWAPGAMPTVDFLLSHFRNSAKNDAVKSHVWQRSVTSTSSQRNCRFVSNSSSGRDVDRSGRVRRARQHAPAIHGAPSRLFTVYVQWASACPPVIVKDNETQAICKAGDTERSHRRKYYGRSRFSQQSCIYASVAGIPSLGRLGLESADDHVWRPLSEPDGRVW
jgi:hypothetical protein